MLTEQEQKILDFFIKNESDFSYQPPEVKSVDYSAVIISRNRCPHNKQEYFKNPLIWCVESVLRQNILPQELVLLNDCSDSPPIDFTDEMIEMIEEKCRKVNIDFVYMRHKERMNAAKARNHGAEIAKNEIIHFIDDDGVLRDETSFGVILFEQESNRDSDLFMLNLPQNTRTSHPIIRVKVAQMGSIDKSRLDLGLGLVTRFPEEYINDPPTIEINGQKIFKPIILENFQGGNVIISKNKLLAIGGFPDYGSPISYGEETGLAIRATKENYKIYYFPYNNLASVHMTYGNPSGRQEFYGLDWLEGQHKNTLSLKAMVKESIKRRTGTGMRVDREVYFYVKIRNFTILLEELEDGLGAQWIKKSHEDFVVNNDIKFQDSKGVIDDKMIRERIWAEAVKDAQRGKCKSIKEIENF